MEIPDADKYEIEKNSAEEDAIKQWEKIISEIKDAMRNARDIKEAELDEKYESQLINKFLNGEINLKQYNEQSRKELLPGEVELPDIEALYSVIEEIINDQEIAHELAEHERSHHEEAIRLGFDKSKILIRFFKKYNELSFRPAIAIELPEEGDENLIRQNLRIVIEAPINLSDTDIEQTK